MARRAVLADGPEDTTSTARRPTARASPDFCFGHWQTQCRATYGAPVDPHVVLGGFPNGPAFRNFSADATSLVVTYPVAASSDNRCAAPPGANTAPWAPTAETRAFQGLAVRMVLQVQLCRQLIRCRSCRPTRFSHHRPVAPVQREASGHCRHKLLKPWRTAHGSA